MKGVKIRAEPGETLRPEARLPAEVTLTLHLTAKEAHRQGHSRDGVADSRKSWTDAKGSVQVDPTNTSNDLTVNKPCVTMCQPH